MKSVNSSSLHDLVQSYLVHYAYVETLQGLEDDINGLYSEAKPTNSKILHNGLKTTLGNGEYFENNRQ